MSHGTHSFHRVFLCLLRRGFYLAREMKKLPPIKVGAVSILHWATKKGRLLSATKAVNKRPNSGSRRKDLDCSGHLTAQPLAERWPLNACWCKHRMRSPAYRSNENSPKVFLPQGCRHVSFFCFLEPSHA